jgi:hypothetical protein
MTDLSIIIVNYNVKQFLLNLVESIYKAVKGISFEIIVVDNASEDGSIETIQNKYPDIRLIANKINVGFGSANNQAIQLAKGKYLLLLNPDTIVNEDTFTKMISFFNNNNEVGIAGCKVLNPDGTLQLACRRSFPGPWTSFTKVIGLSQLFPKTKLFARYNLTYLDENKSYEVDAVSGAFMMIRKEVYERIGGFDQQFFMYGEDLDICFRAQKAGYKVFYVHTTEIIHYKGESTKRSSIDETKVFYDAMQLFVRKHLSSSFIVGTILQTAIIIRKLLAFAQNYSLAIFSALMDLIVFSVSVIIAEKIYSNPHWRGFPDSVQPWVYIVPSFIQLVISIFGSVYKKNSISILRVFISLFYGLILLSSLTFFFKQVAFSRAVVLITYLLSMILLSGWRIAVKIFFNKSLNSDIKKSRTLIIGDDLKTEELASKLKTYSSKVYKIIGFVSFRKDRIGEKAGAYKILGSTENIKKLINDEKIDKVIFSNENLALNLMFAIVAECQGTNVEFLVAGKELDYLVGKSSITMLDDIPLLKVQYNISSLIHRFAKRSFDLTLSSLILILIYPFIYLIKKFISRKSDFIHFIFGVPGVFLGRNSFVGPRVVSFHDDLYVGKTGLTGYWYVENLSESDADEIKKLDIFYAKNSNICFDLEILGLTFAKMFFTME